MAATNIAGFGGAFAGPGTAGVNLVSINEWSGTLEVDQAVIPPSFGEVWEKARPTIQRFTGSCKGRLTYGTTGTKPWTFATAGASLSIFKGTATLTCMPGAGTAGASIAGSFIFTTLTMTRPHNGTAEITANFRNSGNNVALSWNAVEAV